jgi:protein O-mannosyl-transferase
VSTLINHLKREKFLYLLLIILLGLYAFTLGHGFVFDDEHFIIRNQFLKDFKFLPKILTMSITEGSSISSNLYRPVQLLTHFIDIQIWGPRPFGHHLTQLAILIIAAIGLYRTWIALSIPKLYAFLFSLFFFAHPLQAEVIPYLSGRGDLLGWAFFFWGFIQFSKRYVFSMLLFTLAIFSKESMSFFPFYLSILFYLKERRFPDFRKLVIPFTLMFLYIISRLTFLNFKNTLNFYSEPNLFTENITYRIFTFFTTLPKVLGLWFFPHDLHHERSWSIYTQFINWEVFAGFSLICFSFISFFYFWKRKKEISLIILWFFISAFPTSNLIVLINALFYDHWFIFPGLSFLLLASVYLSNSKFKKVFTPILIIYLASFVIITPYYSSKWKSSLTLNKHIYQYEKKSLKILHNLGMAYSDSHQEEKAIRLYNEAIAQETNYPQTYHNLGYIYYLRKDHKKAENYFKQALKINPRFYSSKNYLGQIYYTQGQYSKAVLEWNQSLEIFPYQEKLKKILSTLKRK